MLSLYTAIFLTLCHYIFSIMLLARTLATIAQAEASRQEEVTQKFMSLIHGVADEKSNICHKLMGEQFSSQIEVLRVSFDSKSVFQIGSKLLDTYQ